jgi:hypothetical protein
MAFALKLRLPALLLSMLLGASAAMSQLLDFTPESASTQLSGPTTRTWILKNIDKRMGSVADCEGDGQVYAFGADHKVIEERCVSGHVQKQSQSWAFESSTDELVLKIGDKVFLARFIKREGNNVEMRLRDPAIRKSTETTDMIFRMSLD